MVRDREGAQGGCGARGVGRVWGARPEGHPLSLRRRSSAGGCGRRDEGGEDPVPRGHDALPGEVYFRCGEGVLFRRQKLPHRSLLSEGRIRYETVESTSEGLETRLIVREGPIGLIVTATQMRLHPENETRILSLMVTDTQLQTRAVMRAKARKYRRRDQAGPNYEGSMLCRSG